MKKSLSLIFAACVFLTQGCNTTPQQAIYQTEATTVTSVDAAMKLWAAYVQTNHLTVAQQQPVINAYTKYQAAMLATIDTTIVALQVAQTTTNGITLTTLTTGVTSLSSAANDVLNAITAFGIKL